MSVVKAPNDCGLGGLVLGSAMFEADRVMLAQHGITHILQVGNELVPSHKDVFQYKKINVHDYMTENLGAYFGECLRFIDEGRRSGSVLVHCLAGVSRSATIVIAYLMYRDAVSLQDAAAAVRLVRPCILPNPGFMLQLRAFEEVQCDLDVPLPWDQGRARANMIAAAWEEEDDEQGQGW